jgi:hypothetical protein
VTVLLRCVGQENSEESDGVLSIQDVGRNIQILQQEHEKATKASPSLHFRQFHFAPLFHFAKPIPTGRTRQILPTLVQRRRPPPCPAQSVLRSLSQCFDLQAGIGVDEDLKLLTTAGTLRLKQPFPLISLDLFLGPLDF